MLRRGKYTEKRKNSFRFFPAVIAKEYVSVLIKGLLVWLLCVKPKVTYATL